MPPEQFPDGLEQCCDTETSQELLPPAPRPLEDESKSFEADRQLTEVQAEEPEMNETRFRLSTDSGAFKCGKQQTLQQKPIKLSYTNTTVPPVWGHLPEISCLANNCSRDAGGVQWINSYNRIRPERFGQPESNPFQKKTSQPPCSNETCSNKDSNGRSYSIANKDSDGRSYNVDNKKDFDGRSYNVDNKKDFDGRSYSVAKKRRSTVFQLNQIGYKEDVCRLLQNMANLNIYRHKNSKESNRLNDAKYSVRSQRDLRDPSEQGVENDEKKGERIGLQSERAVSEGHAPRVTVESAAWKGGVVIDASVFQVGDLLKAITKNNTWQTSYRENFHNST